MTESSKSVQSSSERISTTTARQRRNIARAEMRDLSAKDTLETVGVEPSSLSLAAELDHDGTKTTSTPLNHFIEFLRHEGGKVGGNCLGRLYLRHPYMREVLTRAGGLKSFCEEHAELDFADGVVTLQPMLGDSMLAEACTEAHVLELLIRFAESEGGFFYSATVEKLYKKHPKMHEILCNAGGLKQFCALHSELVFESDKCVLNTQMQVPSDIDFVSVATVLPCKVEYPERVAAIIAHVERAASCVESVSVHAFGSAVNGFGDAASDVDLVLEASPANLRKGLDLGKVSKKDLAPRSLACLQRSLRQHGFTIVQKVLGAKVPILKLKRDGVDCDLSCNNLLPVFNTRLLKAYSEIDRRIVDLTQAVKAWARSKGVHGAPHGNLSSYAFTLMSIFYMQMRGALPCIQRAAPELQKFYSEGGKKYNVAMDLSSPSGQKPGVAISFNDFVLFYLTEYVWGDASVVSVRRGVCQGADCYPELKMTLRERVGEAEARELLHIEDPFDVCRNLNCVLAPGRTVQLWCALEDAAAEVTKPPATAAVPAPSAFPPLGSAQVPNTTPKGRRVWRSRGWQ
mmetsp:Transcript_21906/g.61218  ORF Transcript_21906/g.61218 Transcript_21906/m.61218 type:complete len:571 (-) Transcript_21906:93-1805(-)